MFLGRDYGNTQDYSEETARRIDEEVAKIMKEAHDRAHAILSSHADQMDLMASVLLERETVEGEACEALLDNQVGRVLGARGRHHRRQGGGRGRGPRQGRRASGRLRERATARTARRARRVARVLRRPIPMLARRWPTRTGETSR